MAPTVRALILDPGAGRSALAGCRALGRRGWSVGIASPTSTPAARSRWARSFHHVPPADDPTRYVDAVAAVVGDGRFTLVLPAGDAEALALSAGRHAVAATVPYADHAVVARAFDKQALAEAARRCGIAVPGTGADVVPAVVKSRQHGSVRVEAVVAHTSAEVAEAVGRVEAAGGEAVVQEYVPGELTAVAIVADRTSTIVAWAQQRAGRVWPTDAGVSTRAVTTPVDAGLARAVATLVAELGWVGLAQFQFLVPADGAPRLIDCNGRLYGSLALAEAAGAELVSAWAEVASDGSDRRRATTTATAGRRYQWLEGDVRRAVVERRRGLPVDLASTVAYAFGASHSILRLDDLGPAAAHAVALARRAAGKAARRWT